MDQLRRVCGLTPVHLLTEEEVREGRWCTGKRIDGMGRRRGAQNLRVELEWPAVATNSGEPFPQPGGLIQRGGRGETERGVWAL